MSKIKKICVYCGANSGNHPEFAFVAKELGALLAKNNIELVYGGGRIGLMGIIADSVLANGGTVTGIIPQKLVDKEQAHGGLTDLRVVNDMHERKAAMAALADAFIALPGGFGTLEELFEVVTWGQIGYHQKPVVVLNVVGFYDQLDAFIKSTLKSGLIRSEYSSLWNVVSSSEEALQKVRELVISY